MRVGVGAHDSKSLCTVTPLKATAPVIPYIFVSLQFSNTAFKTKIVIITITQMIDSNLINNTV